MINQSDFLPDLPGFFPKWIQVVTPTSPRFTTRDRGVKVWQQRLIATALLNFPSCQLRSMDIENWGPLSQLTFWTQIYELSRYFCFCRNLMALVFQDIWVVATQTMFNFHPYIPGEMIPTLTSICFRWVVETANQTNILNPKFMKVWMLQMFLPDGKL